MSVFAERLKFLRDRKGQTQDEVGKAVGKSRESVSKYEIGEREPDLEVIASMAKHFNVTADYMLGITDELADLSGDDRKPYNSELYAYEKYLKDPRFLPYLQIAMKIQDHKLDLETVKKFIDNMIKSSKKQKRP